MAKEIYNTETLLVTDEKSPIKLSQAIYLFIGWENYTLIATIDLDNKILFRVDGGDPYSAHCMYGLQYCNEATRGDSIELEDVSEIMGFRVVKVINNCLLTINYYREAK